MRCSPASVANDKSCGRWAEPQRGVSAVPPFVPVIHTRALARGPDRRSQAWRLCAQSFACRLRAGIRIPSSKEQGGHDDAPAAKLPSAERKIPRAVKRTPGASPYRANTPSAHYQCSCGGGTSRAGAWRHMIACSRIMVRHVRRSLCEVAVRKEQSRNTIAEDSARLRGSPAR